ncbi:MAG: AMP-binding protein [Candidatus Levybacteria bacterium]|nr:AMP-binding protein [Candidatus Levybacteria bacterium]
METLIDLLPLFKKRGKKEVFIYRTGIRRFTFSYRQLYDLSLKMASYLEERGIKKGDRVALWAPNSPFWAVCFFGILLKEAIVVPIDFASGKQRAQNIIRLSGSSFVIESNYKFEKLSGIKSIAIEDLDFLLRNISSKYNFPKPKPNDIAEIVYTSGTTGNPKGVELNHKNLVTNILQAEHHIRFPSRFSFLSVLPLSHLFEQTAGFLTPLHRGDKIVYLRTIKPLAIMEAFSQENVAAMLVVPRLLLLLKNSIEREFDSLGLRGFLNINIFKKILSYPVHRKIGSNFQMFISGGAGLPTETYRFWNSMGFRVVEGYGLTECSPIVCANTFDKQIPGSVGKLVKGVKVKVDNGELLVKGDNVFSGYYRNDKETEKAFNKDGWFRTGDLASFDKEGNIYIKGRKKDVIITPSGVHVYPLEVEEVLNHISGVKESCVFGLNRGKGEETHAVLLLNDPNVNPSKIIQLANEKLDPLAQIEGFSVWKDYDFPRTTTLKVQKFKVLEAVSGKVNGNDPNLKDALVSLLSTMSKKPGADIRENSILTTDLGLDSISRLELINFLEQEYRLDLEDSNIDQYTTVSDLRRMLEKRGDQKKKSGLWFWTNNKRGRILRKFLDKIFHIPISHLFFDLEVIGLSNLKNIKPPVVFISNHVSYLDQPAIMFALPSIWRYSTASAVREEFFFNRENESLFHKLLFPYTIFAFNGFLLPQKSGFRKSLSFMGKLIDNNRNILVFPEGTRSKNGEILPFMHGLGIIVKELQVPLVTIRIIGMEKIFPRGKFFPKKGKCFIVIGKALNFTTETPSEIVEKSRRAILSLGNKLDI